MSEHDMEAEQSEAESALPDDATPEEIKQAEEEFGSEKAPHTGALEAQMARHLHNKYRRAGGQPSFLSRAWFKAALPHPVNHIKTNLKTIMATTAGGGGLAAVGSFALSQTFGTSPDPVAVMETAALSYPAWRLADEGFARLGFYIGHTMNALNEDRFQEVKTEPAGRWFGRASVIGMAFLGGVYGSDYVDAVSNVTIEAPHTVTQGVPSFVVDTLTNLNNTAYDPVWELDDHAKCLTLENVNASHNCLDGPGADQVLQLLNGKIAPESVDMSQELSYGGRGMQNISDTVDGVYQDSWAQYLWQNYTIDVDWDRLVPEIPTRETINDRILGGGEPKKQPAPQ